MGEPGSGTVKAVLPVRAFLLVSRWKAAWSSDLETNLTWAEFLETMANDKNHWPAGQHP